MACSIPGGPRVFLDQNKGQSLPPKSQSTQSSWLQGSLSCLGGPEAFRMGVFLAQLQLLLDLHSVLFSHSPPTGVLVALSPAISHSQERAREPHVSHLTYSYQKGHHSERDAREKQLFHNRALSKMAPFYSSCS